jgi:hypothetical protein
MKTLAEQRRFWRNILAVAVAATVLITGAQLVSAGDGPFTDVPVDHPFGTEISEVAAAGIAEGFSDGTYRPNQVVTRQAMAAFLARAGSSISQITGTVDSTIDSTSFEVIRNLIVNVPGNAETQQRVLVTAYLTVSDTSTAGCSPCVVGVRVSGASNGGERLYRLEPDSEGDVRDTVIASSVFTVDGGDETFQAQARIISASAGTPVLTVSSTTVQALVVPFSATPAV